MLFGSGAKKGGFAVNSNSELATGRVRPSGGQETARSTRSDQRSCHTKVTLKFLTVRRALKQAESYEISQIWPQNPGDRALDRN